MKTNSKIIDAVVETMSITAKDLLPSFKIAISQYNNNGLSANVWAHRGDVITDKFQGNEDINVLHISRGSLWQFEAILDQQNNELYIMINENNLRKLKMKFKKEHFSNHYLYSFLHYNNSYNSSDTQLELLDDEYKKKNEERRINDCHKMLADYADKVDKIIVVSFGYVQDIITNGKIELFDGQYNEVDSIDISNKIIELNKTPEEKALGVNKKKKNAITKPLVKLKANKSN